MPRTTWKTLIICTTVTLCACSVEDDEPTDHEDDATEDDEAEPRIFGSSSFDNCLSTEIALMRNAVRLGRWVTTTDEFVSCIQNAGYGACSEDDMQTVASALGVVGSSNAYEVECDWLDDGSASADIDDWDNAGTEEIVVDIDYLTQKLAQPAMAGQAAIGGTLWHELMHQHGYRHGGSDDAQENRDFCDQQPSWIWNVHSMPYIVGNCFEDAALNTTRDRLDAAGYDEPLLTYVTKLIEISLTIGGIVDQTQYDQTQIAVAWRRKMRAQHSNKCMGVVGNSTADNALVQQFTCSNTNDAQRWVSMPIVNNPVGTDPRYVIMNVNSGKCLDRPWGNVANHTVLQQYPCHGMVAQQFRRRSTGQYEAMTATGASNQCLDIGDASVADGATLQMSLCKAASSPSIGNQVFSMVF